jgi:4-diphosphocytidyl-2-C-methyl-D-erythritol kinase
VILFPNCKINLGLHITHKRADGFHDLQTIFYPLKLQDALEIIEHSDKSVPHSITVTGIPIDVTGDNICVKAYQLLKKDFDLPPIQIHLHKAIPIGAGLGGGSADGAFTLLLLNKKFDLQLSEETLIDYALQLGSDCPFFIKNKPCYATSRGEELVEINVDLSMYKILLVNPKIHINTGWAFSQINPKPERISHEETIKQPVSSWKDQLTNDFEEAIFLNHPSIAAIKNDLYKIGAAYSSMTGTGSTVFALFEKQLEPDLNFPNHYFVRWVN